jgi:enoyl-CoA hydratase/carnithine racemase
MDVVYEKQDEIGYITLNRPEKSNALSSKLLVELYDILKDVSEKRDVKVLILRGEGKNFCSGHDLNEILNDPIEVERHFTLCGRVMHAIRNAPQPIIAMVRGYAVAGGCQLVAVCDLAVAEENAKFSLPGIKLGLFCYTPAVFVSRCVGLKRAFELAFTGETIDAKTALDWGLINRVVPNDKLEEVTHDLAKKIARFNLDVIERGKAFFYRQLTMDVFSALTLGVKEIALNSTFEETRDMIERFLKK